MNHDCECFLLDGGAGADCIAPGAKGGFQSPALWVPTRSPNHGEFVPEEEFASDAPPIVVPPELQPSTPPFIQPGQPPFTQPGNPSPNPFNPPGQSIQFNPTLPGQTQQPPKAFPGQQPPQIFPGQ